MTSRTVSELVSQEQIALTCRQLGVLSISSLAADAIGVVLFYGKVPLAAMLYWLGGAAIGTVVIPLLVLAVARKKNWQCYPVRPWKIALIVTGCLGGSIWGSAGIVMFVPDSIVDQQFLLILLLGGTSLTMVMMAAYPPAFYATLVPMLLPITLRLLSDGNPMSLAIALVPIVYGITLAILYQMVHKTLLESLRLRFELASTAEALAEQKTRAEQATLAKSRFFAAASHDLRQPLHAQGLFVEELQLRNRDTKSEAILVNLKRSQESMQELFNSLLDVSRLDTSVVKPNYERFSIHVLLHELMLDFAPLALQKGLALRLAHSNAVVHSDPTILKRIIGNFMSNAIRYTRQGKVLVGCRRRADRLRIEVWDTGTGIPTQDQEHIFEEFQQLHNPERDRRKGLGLGLAIVKRLAALVHCPIALRSQLNKGSVFSVTVPFVRTASAELHPPSMLVDQTPALSGHTILVIDDEPEILRGMQGLLERWGCRVLIAESITQAAAQVRGAEWSLSAIIADYRLRDHKTGIDAIVNVRSLLNRDVPAVLITGDTTPERLNEAQTSGYHILYKPVPPARLRTLLEHVVRSNPPHAESPKWRSAKKDNG